MSRIKIKKEFFFLYAVILLYIIFYFRPVNYGSFSEQESASIYYARQDTKAIITGSCLPKDHSPFFYVLLHYWISALGTGEAVSRIYPAIFGLLSIFLTYRIGRLLFKEEAGLLSAFLLCISSGFLHRAYDLKHWILHLFFFLFTLFFILKLFRKEKTYYFLWFIIGATLGIYNSFYGYALPLSLALFIIAMSASFLFYDLFLKKKMVNPWQPESKWMGKTALGLAIVFLLSLPQHMRILDALKMVTLEKRVYGGLEPHFPNFFYKAFFNLFDMGLGGYEKLLLFFCLCLFIYGCYLMRRKDGSFILLNIFLVLFFSYWAALQGASIRIRYLISLLPLSLVILSGGILSLKARSHRVFWSIIITASFLFGLSDYFKYQRDDWRSAGLQIRQRYESGDRIFIMPVWAEEGLQPYIAVPAKAVDRIESVELSPQNRLWFVSLEDERRGAVNWLEERGYKKIGEWHYYNIYLYLFVL